jgi:hypothetical protein
MYSLFGRFAASGAAFIDATRVRNDIDNLKAVIDRVNRYTTTVIAHRDAAVAKGATPCEAITCGDLDNAINTIGAVHARYYTLCHPGESLAILTPFAPLTWGASVRNRMDARPRRLQATRPRHLRTARPAVNVTLCLHGESPAMSACHREAIRVKVLTPIT